MTKKLTFETPFDTYAVTKLLGEGGAGRVYEVVTSSGEVRALKCLSPERITSERLKRFKNEIAYCQRQNHPNVVKVLDTGFMYTKDVKCPFYVMKRYSGTLRTHMGNLSPEEALRAYAQILDGVEAAHLSGVWHRDMKPENVLWNESEKTLVVADFGIAHFEVEELYTAMETRSADRLANFLYSAPEQRVRGAEVGVRSDIFSLGLILNEMFTSEVPQGAGFKRIRDVHSEFSYLDDVVDSMIQQSPDSRVASIDEVKRELIGRKNAFVAQQRLDAATRQVVPTAKPESFEPLAFVALDYVGSVLSLILNRNTPPGWAQHFQNPRGGYSSILGYGPERFQVNGNKVSISIHNASDDTIQQLVNHAKTYASMANATYVAQLAQQADQKEHEQRAALQRQIAEAERRKSVLEKVKL